MCTNVRFNIVVYIFMCKKNYIFYFMPHIEYNIRPNICTASYFQGFSDTVHEYLSENFG